MDTCRTPGSHPAFPTFEEELATALLLKSTAKSSSILGRERVARLQAAVSYCRMPGAYVLAPQPCPLHSHRPLRSARRVARLPPCRAQKPEMEELKEEIKQDKAKTDQGVQGFGV